MAWLNACFYSDVLRIDCNVSVVYPQNTTRTPPTLRDVIKPPYQVLYLLHGLMRNETSWQRLSSIEQYVMDMGLAVIMPTTQRGWFVNQAHGYRWEDFIVEELPEVMSKMFHISRAREDTFIAGLSMGGYGAFKAALSYPERYSCAASLSGCIDLGFLVGTDVITADEMYMSFGTPDPRGSEFDIYEIARRQLKEKGKDALPALYATCGTEDPLHKTNMKFRDEMKDVLNLTYHEEQGDHVWSFWDRNIQKVLDWLPIKQRDKGYVQKFIPSKN
ncbi:MAG: esterase family protein [Synergistaceae bacterium]|jgi:S-formylglutathione hydrolase FrmB|nr:esterase family protein [Synergistaceae bacterium]